MQVPDNLESLRKRLPPGSFSEIARETGMAYSTVKQVLHGKHFNKDVILLAAKIADSHEAAMRQVERAARSYPNGGGKRIDPDRVTTDQAAHVLGRTSRNVRQLYAKRRLPGRTEDGRILFKLSDLQKFLRTYPRK